MASFAGRLAPRSVVRHAAAQRAERQADAAATRVLRGERGVRDVGRAPAAASPGIASLGAPLPADLRERLERGFGAELSAVRVHTDTAAADAAEREGARAFAAGRDVFLGREVRADMRAERNVRTVAHEVAHVLQQTGADGADGQLVARDVAGSSGADVQREEFADWALKHLDDTPPEYKTIRDAYAPEKAAASEIAEVSKIYNYGFAWATEKDHDKLVARTKTAAFASLASEVKAFYADCLKAVERFDDAAAIVKTLPADTRTAYRSRKLYEKLRPDVAWLAALARTQSFTKLFYPSGVLDAFRHYLYGPVQIVVPPLADYDKRFDAERKRIFDQKDPRVDSERTFMAVVFVDQLVTHQREALESFGDATKADRPDIAKLAIAEAYASAKSDDATLGAPKEQLELRAYVEDLWPDLQKIATGARDFWRRIKTLRDALLNGFAFESMSADEVKALGKEIGAHPAFATLDATLEAVVTALVNVAPVPEPTEYGKRVASRREALRVHAGRYGASLIEYARKEKRSKDDDRQMLRLGLVLRHLLFLRQHLADSYDAATDAKLAKDSHDDERLAARVRIADAFWGTGTFFGLPRTVAAADRFLAVDQPSLALLSDWVQDAKPVGPVDFQGGESASLEGTGLSDTRISQFFFAEYLNSLAAAIETALDPTNPNAAQTRTSILGDALKAVKAVDRPERYLLAKYEYWYDPAGAFRMERGQRVEVTWKQWYNLVLYHWRTQAFKRKLGDGAQQWTGVRPPKNHAPIVLWNVPRFDRFIERLMRIKPLDDLVQDYLRRTPRIIIIPIDAPTTTTSEPAWKEWFGGLAGLAEELHKKQQTDATAKQKLEALGGELAGPLDKDYGEAKQRYYRAARLATVRQVLPLLERYRDSERDNAYVPERVFDLVTQFVVATKIDDDQPIQATLLALELADALAETFSPKTLYWTYDVLGTLARFTTGAADVWNDPKLQPEVLKGKQPTATDAELTQHAVTLAKMRDVLTAALLDRQKSRGLTGRKTTGGATPNTNGEIGTVDLVPTVEAGKSFTMYLREWELVKVHEDFDYVPRWAGIESLGMEWPNAAAGRVGEAMVIDASGGSTQGTPLAPTTKLLTMRRRTHQPKPKSKKTPRGLPGPWEDIEITAGNVETLQRLYRDFGDFSGLEYIRVAAEATVMLVEFELELAEFIPGVGQGITVGRFIAAIVSFLESDEFEQMMEAIKKEGFDVIPDLIKKVASLLKPSAAKILGWFFFGRPTQIPAPQHETSHIEEQQKQAASGGVWTKIARAIRNIVHFGKRLLGTVEILRNAAQAPFRAAQRFVLSHPGLAMVVGLAIRYFDVLASLVMGLLFGDEDEKQDKDFVERMKQAVKGGVAGLAEGITRSVNVVREFQLPEEILPLDLVGDFVIDRVIASLGAKYKLGAKLGRFALQKLPGNPWKLITEKIGKALVDVTGIDPNKIYQDTAREYVQDAIDGVRTDAFGTLQTEFDKIGLLKELGVKVDFSPGAKTVIDFAGMDFHDGSETEQTPESSAHAAPSVGPLSAPSGGVRLPAPMRARAEASLGHDLSHVRLHHGSEGAAVTGRMHADAVASGSHVFLHPTVSPGGDGRGQHVLHHELGHVLQQTGSRPLGGAYDDTPSAGRPGRGLTIDPAREAAADRAAARRASPTSVAAPIDVGPPAEGPQPILDRDFIKEMLEQLRDPQRLKEEAVDVGSMSILSAENKLRTDALNRGLAEQLPGKLAAAIRAMLPGDFEPPFNTIADKLKAAAASPENEAHFAKAIKVLVAEVRTPRSSRRAKDEGPTEPGMWVRPERFAHELERYLYALTGLAIRLAFTVKEGPPSVGNAHVIDLDATHVVKTAPISQTPAMRVAPFAKMTVGYVHLPFLGDAPATHQLWELLATNSFSSEPGFSTEKELWIAATRLAVGHLLPKPGMYLQNKFELTALSKKSTRSQIGRIRPLTAHWPSPGNYKEDDSSKVTTEPDSVATHTGLRVGTFGTLEKERVDEKVTDRDPHHVPQVLLLDYFSNKHNKLHPFPELIQKFEKDLYPKVTAVPGGEVTEIGPIDVHTYTTGTRSDNLPAILLAVHTHQAEVHVGTEPPDEKSRTATMGGWVQRRFQASLGTLWKVMADRRSLVELKNEPSKTKAIDTNVGVRTSSDALGDAIVTGARATYSEMRTEMMNKLKRGLREQEIQYYDLIAAAKKGSPLTDAEKLKSLHVDYAYEKFDAKVGGIMKTSRFET